MPILSVGPLLHALLGLLCRDRHIDVRTTPPRARVMEFVEHQVRPAPDGVGQVRVAVGLVPERRLPKRAGVNAGILADGDADHHQRGRIGFEAHPVRGRADLRCEFGVRSAQRSVRP
jgi:hypothetical protein